MLRLLAARQYAKIAETNGARNLTSGGWLGSVFRGKTEAEKGADQETPDQNVAAQSAGASSSWIPSWLRQKLPGYMGGDGTNEFEKLKAMDLDAYGKSLSQARTMSGIAGAFGNQDARLRIAKLKRSEEIIAAMTAEEKKDPLSNFGTAGKSRVAGQVGCTLYEVNDVIASYYQMKLLGEKVVELRSQGKPLPNSPEEFQALVDDSFKNLKHARGAKDAPEVQKNMVATGKKGPNGQPCPLAGRVASRNTVCPLTKKKFKRCCGK